MEADQHELYENVKSRVTQKRFLFYHLVLLLIGSVFLFVVNKWLSFYPEKDWWTWVVTIWVFIFIFHTIKFFIINKFMDKNWERNQIDKLILQQTKKIEVLKINQNKAKTSEE